MSTPSPLFMPPQKTTLTARPVAADVTAHLGEGAPAIVTGLVRPGLVDEVITTKHDGIIKAKHLKEGQVVRAHLHGAPRGGERIVQSVEKVEGGQVVRVTFSSPHPVTDYKPAYRFHVEALVGTEITMTKRVPGLVPYEEV